MPAPKPAATWEVHVGAAAQITGGIGPTALSSAAAFLGLEQGRRRGTVLALAARLVPEAGTSRLLAGSAAPAHFALYAARFEGCPLRIELGERVRLHPCVGVQAGILHAQGVEVSRSASADLVWIDARALLRLRLQTGRSRGLFLEASAGVVAPISRTTFVFQDPRVVVYEAPWAAPLASLGAGIAF